ncbi:MAG: hypothetical protein BGO89_02035 [Candidatus Kapaibacterium thiocyanatum]|uniref:DUF4292 domain-containing protein n=1 Tax=Candidatus Kapaibacterium thiocyanatum TaxID=1895771 RepID=A0A1M3L1X2_9BACT|nr:MAG: hypothetical protein BGO89_02035 ['Candidatus Kapabacteria' thiocyanatum]
MDMQSTTSKVWTHLVMVITAVTILSCSSTQQSTTGQKTGQAQTLSSTSAEPTAMSPVAANIRTMVVEGSVSATGTQNIQGLPFDAVIVEQDSFRIDMGGPLGITAARLFSAQASFAFVNYLTREVMDGNPASPSLAKVMPFPINVTDLMALMRGSVPGDAARFREESVRKDGSVLYSAADGDGREYALVDTARDVLLQYQRKSATGALLMNVTFTDVRDVEAIPVAHAVEVTVDDRRQSMSFRLQKVRINEPVTTRLSIDIPSSFKRTTYR